MARSKRKVKGPQVYGPAIRYPTGGWIHYIGKEKLAKSVHKQDAPHGAVLFHLIDKADYDRLVVLLERVADKLETQTSHEGDAGAMSALLDDIRKEIR